MNIFTSSIIAAALSLSALSVTAGTSTQNVDDASNLGTAESPQVQEQQMRTDKGVTEMQVDPIKDDASNLGNVETPQVQKQQMRTDKGPSVNPSDRPHSKKSKLMRKKDMNSGTTKGNKVQPNQPQEAAPVAN